MRHNPYVKPSKVAHNPAKGNGKPYTSPPANNVGTMKVPLGTSKGSKIVGDSNGTSAGKAGTISSQKTKTPTTNYVNTTFKHGTTMHGVGQVPAYLKGKQGNSTNV